MRSCSMVQAGADPGRPVVLKHPMLGWRKGDVVSPLLVGIAEGNSVHVAFLFKNTKRKDHAPNDQALCVAARFGHGSVASMLFGMGVPAAPQRGCDGRDKMPEEVAARFGNGSLAKALKTYRQSRARPRCTRQRRRRSNKPGRRAVRSRRAGRGGAAQGALVLWLCAALSAVGLIAGFNVVVDPFGYFGTNRIGYYFSSEREFKYALVRGGSYNAILLGDSRMAFTDPAYIHRPGLSFINGGIGGATAAEQVALLSASRLDGLKLAVFGLNYQDLASTSNCSDEAVSPRVQAYDWLSFAASWTQLGYAIDALSARATGRSPKYHGDGTRSDVAKQIHDIGLDAKSPRYWRKIEREMREGPDAEPRFAFVPPCRALMRRARKLADRHGFTLVVVFLPRNSDLLAHMHFDRPNARKVIETFVAEVEGVVPHVVDLSSSAFSESGNFWLDDFHPLQAGGRRAHRRGGHRPKHGNAGEAANERTPSHRPAYHAAGVFRHRRSDRSRRGPRNVAHRAEARYAARSGEARPGGRDPPHGFGGGRSGRSRAGASSHVSLAARRHHFAAAGGDCRRRCDDRRLHAEKHQASC